MLGGAPPSDAPSDADVAAAARDALEGGGTARDAAAAVADELGITRKRAYAAVLAERNAG